MLGRDQRKESYEKTEVDRYDIFQASEGSSITGYYDDGRELQIIEILIYQSRHKVIIHFYPFDDAVAIISKTIRYASDKPLVEMTEDDMYLDAVAQMVMKDNQVYHYIDEREPMHPSDNTWYADMYANAVRLLGNASAANSN